MSSSNRIPKRSNARAPPPPVPAPVFLNLLSKPLDEAVKVFGDFPDWYELEILQLILDGEQELEDDEDEDDYMDEDEENDGKGNKGKQEENDEENYPDDEEDD